MVSKEEIASLIYLLEDPDEFVRDSVMDRFTELGEATVPLIDEFRAGTREESLRQTLDEIILKLTFPSLEQDFLNFAEGGIMSMQELEAAVLMLVRIDNPTFREELYIRQLNRMALEIEGEINYTLQPLKQVRILMDHIFDHHGFSPAREDYFVPAHAHLHSVMDKKMGIPLTLAFIALFLARRLELPLSGVNMPAHFMMRFDYDSQVVFLDPFNAGKFVTLNECLNFLKRNNIRPEQTYFNPAHPAQMLLRAMRNLQNSYKKVGDPIRLKCIELLITHFELLYGMPGDEPT